jgi:hypothetical protein
MEGLTLVIGVVAIVLSIALLVRRATRPPQERARRLEKARRSRRDLAQWGASLAVLGLLLSFAYLALPQSSSSGGFATVQISANPGTVIIAGLATLFAALATIRHLWARLVFGILALVTGALLVWARITDISDVRDLGLDVGSGLWVGLVAAIAITVGAILCIAGVATVPEAVPQVTATPVPPPPPMPARS